MKKKGNGSQQETGGPREGKGGAASWAEWAGGQRQVSGQWLTATDTLGVADGPTRVAIGMHKGQCKLAVVLAARAPSPSGSAS